MLAAPKCQNASLITMYSDIYESIHKVAIIWSLTLGMLDKNFRRSQFDVFSYFFFFFFFFFLENRIWLFMQFVSSEDNLCEISEHIFWEKLEKKPQKTSSCHLLNLPRQWYRLIYVPNYTNAVALVYRRTCKEVKLTVGKGNSNLTYVSKSFSE